MGVVWLGSAFDQVISDGDTNLDVSAPGGVGGRLLAVGNCIDSRTITPPDGWDEIVNDTDGSMRTYLWHRADDGLSDYFYTISGEFSSGSVHMHRYQGASTGTPRYSISTGPNDTTQTPNTILGVTAGSMMIWGLYVPGDTGPCSSSKGVERVDLSQSSPALMFFAATEDNTVGGDTTGAVITSTGFGAKRLFSIAIPPVSGSFGLADDALIYRPIARW